jgi:hypothetical protein
MLYKFLLLSMIGLLTIIPLTSIAAENIVAKIYFIGFTPIGKSYYLPSSRVLNRNPNFYSNALNQLIQGPTAFESKGLGYKKAFRLVGYCIGPDFELRKYAVGNGDGIGLEVKFCKIIIPENYPDSPLRRSNLGDSRTKDIIARTLVNIDTDPIIDGKQGITEIKIVDKYGSCFSPGVEASNVRSCNSPLVYYFASDYPL